MPTRFQAAFWGRERVGNECPPYQTLNPAHLASGTHNADSAGWVFMPTRIADVYATPFLAEQVYPHAFSGCPFSRPLP